MLPPRKTFGAETKQKDNSTPQLSNDVWLRRSVDAYTASTTFFDTNYRKEWEDSIKHFQSKHMGGSKYHSDAYKYRSKLFRPKTRAIVRQSEAAAAAAFFSQLDVLSVEPEDDKDPIQRASCALRQELLNYRLSAGKDKGIPWFQVCVGGMQDGNIYGVICSKQFWDYQEKDVEQPMIDPVSGTQVLDEMGQPAMTTEPVKIKDKPDIKLLPIENCRFDPASEWTDVVNSSPYFICMEPMRIMDVKAKMEKKEWETVDDNTLKSARNAGYDTTRMARDGEREDSTDPRYGQELTEFDIVWVHEVFMRIGGEESHYYTLGTVARLSKVRPLSEVYLHGVRPYVIGTVVIEAHKAVPEAPVHLGKGLQKEANEIVNTRLDNVKLVLNKRYMVKRGKQVDLQSLVRNAPGSVTLVNDTTGDVVPIEFNDVTQSAYAEQDRVNSDLDDLLGSFSQGSVNTNRKLNETVGGMRMLQGSANNMTQYLIRVFNETWVEPVLNQLDMLEQHYESDYDLLVLMGKRANIEKYGIQNVSAELLMQPGRVTVNVANSAMDPAARLDQFLFAMKTYSEMSPLLPPDVDRAQVKAYMFGLLGHKDGSRFDADQGNMPPQMQEAMAKIQEMQQVIQTLQGAIESKQVETQMKLEFEGQIAAAKAESAESIEILKQQAETYRNQQSLEYEHRSEMEKLKMEAAFRERELQMEGSLRAMEARIQAMTDMAANNAKQSETQAKKEPMQLVSSSAQLPIQQLTDATIQIAEKSEAQSQEVAKLNELVTMVVEKLSEERGDTVKVQFVRGEDGKVGQVIRTTADGDKKVYEVVRDNGGKAVGMQEQTVN